MSICRVIMGVVSLAAAGAGKAASPAAIRLPLDIASLGPGPEIVYQPYRWLTIHRRISTLRPVGVAEAVVSPVQALRKAGVISGNVHPFGDNLRVSLGFRQERNRRLLRMNGDESDTYARRYAPVFAVGIAGEAAPGLSLAADIGFVGRSIAYADTAELVTPIDQSSGARGGHSRTMVQLSARYRF
jgi:hypothetical protein